MEVEIAAAVTPEINEAVDRLLPALSSSASNVSADDLRQIVASPATTLLIARDDSGRIVGTLTLAVFMIPSGVRAWIEDVVVGEEARGRGVGAALIEHALQLARERCAPTVDLTSRPSREAANRLYERLGFERRETNAYRYTF